MIFKLFDVLQNGFYRTVNRGVFYDNMGPKGQGVYVTLSRQNVEFTDTQILITHDEHLFYGVAISYVQAQQIRDNQFHNGQIELDCGHLSYRLEENLYRLYDRSGNNWVRVSRENLLAMFDLKTGAYDEVNREWNDPTDGLYEDLRDYH